MRKNRLLILVLTLILGMFLSGCEFVDYINNINNGPEIVTPIEEDADDAALLANLLAEKDLLEAEISQLEIDKTTLTSEITTLGLQKNDLLTEVTNLEEVVDSLNDLIISKNLTIDGLDLEITTKNNTILDLNTQIESKNTEILSLEAQITEYEEDVLYVEDLTNQITQLESDKTTLESTKASLESELLSLNTTKTSLLSEISNLNSQKTILTNTINTLNSQVSTLENDKAVLESEIASLNQELLDLEAQAANYYLDLFDLFNEISIEVMKANVVVKTYKNATSLGSGSGIIMKEDTTYYYLLTNNHVVYMEGYTGLTYKVVDYRGNEYVGTLMFRDANHDLALLKIVKDINKPVLKVMVLDTVNPAVNARIVAIGQPLNQTNTITFGEITTYSTISLGDTPTTVSNVTYSVIFHDARILPGSSGGVLLNLDLIVVGINYAGSYDPETEEFIIAAAIPIEKVRLFLTENSFTL